MGINYKFKNQKLKEMVEKKARELNISVDKLIWGYINRGLMSDNMNEDVFNNLHCDVFLKEVDEVLGVD